MSKDQWKKLVQIHNYAKRLTLLGEEVDPEHEFALGPLIQQRDTLEHIMRAKACELGLAKPEDPESYMITNMDKALGHAYRAFFDAADLVTILYREKLNSMVAPYTTACITAVIPTYYDKILPRTEEISEGIAKVRGAKDIANRDGLLEEVETYIGYVDELHGFYQAVVRAHSGLQDWSRKGRRAGIRNILVKLAIPIVVAILAFVLGRIDCTQEVEKKTPSEQSGYRVPTLQSLLPHEVEQLKVV